MPDLQGTVGQLWPFYAAAVGAWLIGGIPFGLILTRLAGAGDLRRIGSGSFGATNVLRTGRTGLAALTVLLDAGKGAAAVVVGGAFSPDMAIIAGYFAVLGHVMPAWLHLRSWLALGTVGAVIVAHNVSAGGAPIGGWLFVAWTLVAALFATGRTGGGKGVATTFAVLAVVAPPLGAVFAGLWLATALAFRYSSLAGLVAVAATAVIGRWLATEGVVAFQATELAGVLALLVWARHRGNLVRLARGEEPHIHLRRT
ncbi:MAG: glycerol-3-phosphate acyltransferase [Alphaproteobacteria bacterium]